MLPRLTVLIVLFSTLWAACLSSDDSEPTASPGATASRAATIVPGRTATATMSATEGAANPTSTFSPEHALEGTSWQLIELVGEPVDPGFGVTLIFDDEGLIGYSGCNGYGSRDVRIEGSSFEVREMSGTSAGCLPPLDAMNFEARYYDALRNSVRFFLDPPRLAFHGANDDTLLLFELLDEEAARATAPPASADPTPTTPIAQHGNWEIYVMNADGSGQHRVAPSRAGENWPWWLPDGRLSFTSNRTGEERIFTVQPDGTELEELPVDLTYVASPIKWSADGSQIYYASSIDGLEQLYEADADGSNPRRITEIADGTSYPDWSPDGSKVVFTNRSHGPAVIYSINTDGTDLQRLTFDQDATEEWPVWSPDGTQIAFAHHSNDGEGGIFIMDADGGNLRRLTDGGSWVDSAPDWSPDGTRIAFGREGDVWVVNVDGAGLRQLTDSPYFDENPVWSPDGSQIAFVSNRDGGQAIACSFVASGLYQSIGAPDELAWISETIVVGEVVEQFPSAFGAVENDGLGEERYPIYTDYLIDVDTWVRGQPSLTIRMRQNGGSVGACTQTWEDEPEIEVGSRVLLFLHPDERNTELPPASFVVGGYQGFWSIHDDGRVETERYRNLDGISVDHMVGLVRDALRQPEPDYFDLIPLDESPLVEPG